MLDVVILLSGGAIIWTLGWLIKNAPERRYNGPYDWERAAERCGLRVRGATYPRLTARAGPIEVTIEAFGEPSQDTRIVVKAPVAPDFEKVKIYPQSVPSARDVQIGDPGFDDALSIEGPALQLFALLDSDTRRQMRTVNGAGRLEISPGQIQAIQSKGAVSDVLPSLLEIVKRLGTPADIPRSLVENVKRDSESGARLQNLLALIREIPGDPGTGEALRAACSDWSSPVRLQAARAMGAEGRDILLELAHRLEDDGISAEAVSFLGRELPAEQAKTLLDRAAVNGRPRTVRACLEVLGRGGAAGEALLIQTLRHEEADIQLAAARVLGRIGSAAAVLPLKEAAKHFGRDLGFGQATRQAIAEIQSRLQGASPGQLSLAGAEAGQLSLAQDEAGQLSLATDPAGQLSLGDDDR
ncbi:MAG TPA: hypothetical protein VN493_05145 [Thermoanaerobaculia bacterium]|nr:hypothetical protein [Thermoanaerobaculia bacterium]